MQRKLAAILAADVVGYSRLMEADEAETLLRLKSTRANLIDPKVTANNGRVVKLMGDGQLVEFASVVDAVKCAVEIQQAMAECNEELPLEKRLELRIGVNLGDVIVEGDDLYGDGVNVAARLEGLAPPGGVLISGTAFDHVERKLDYAFEFVGEQKVKNIETPVRLYQVRAGSSRSAAPARPRYLVRRPVVWVALAAAIAALGAGGAFYWDRQRIQPDEIASPAKMALPLPDKPSLAVLPFTNMSEDTSEDSFTDGMTDDLITDLSKVSGLFVIARNSTFTYKGSAVKIGKVAEDLGVRYVLEGSVRRAGDRVRVNAQLIDAISGGHVWADRFDGSVSDIFGIQDQFVAKIVEALELRLTPTDTEKIAGGKTHNITAKEAFDEGWSHYLRLTPQDTLAAIAPLKRAIEIDPGYGRAYAALALVYYRAVDLLWFKDFGQSSVDMWAEYQKYVELAKQHPTALSYTVAALDDAAAGRTDQARKNASRAIALDPNDPEAHIAMAWALIIRGEPREALDFVATAMRLNPNSPSHYFLAQGVAQFAAGELERAGAALKDGLERYPEAAALFLPLSSILAQLGNREEARRMLIKFRPDSDQKGLANFPDAYILLFQWDNAHDWVRQRLYDGLRVAALPLDITVGSLEADLKSSDLFKQLFAVRRLGWFGPAAAPAVPSLIEALNNPDLRRETIEALGKIGAPAKAAIPALVALQDEELIGSYARNALLRIRGY
jgi:TolB-like protein/class 3 adenylate cyclase/tetratricopeptide (TPR) repeat protein